ncbi:MAG: hypothetical protein CVU46_08590 [Chloroflexi bacterium HGW-Chloroflexi-8]|nr:MAG: hypothetical protein CVU46_08590 [Chloroflexi bacterium HGW-Chloroflexi-8]
MQNDFAQNTFSLPFTSSTSLTLSTLPFECVIRNMSNLQSAFQWIAIKARIRQFWVDFLVSESYSTPIGFAVHLVCQKYPDISVLCSLQIQDGLLTANLTCPSDLVEALAIDFVAQHDEHFLGFGERFNRIDQRGQEIDLYVVNGASGGLAYKPVPFYMSSAGYGLRLLTSIRTKVRLACYDEPGVVSIRTESNQLTFQLWSGEPFAELLHRYAQLLGLPLYQPPNWVFGPWKSRDWTQDNQQLTLEDLRKPRELKLAGSVKLIDAAWESDLNDFLFNEKYPDPVQLLAEVRRLGYRIVLWISPWMVKNDPNTLIYEFCAKNGFLIKNNDNQPYVHRLGNSPRFMGSCFDFTNPQAVDWWQAQISRLVEMGVDGFKTDFGEQVPDDAIFFDGRTGRELHNLFPVLYNQATFQAMQRHTQGILLARSAWDGSQRYCAVWAGDQSADFGPATGLSSVILAGQNAGLSGFSCWASDIGGYFGQPSDEIFSRWIAFGAFSPIMQLHGLGNREPWNFSEQVLETYKFYSHLHLDLFPYIFTFAQIASQTGIPLMRALPFAFPHDPGIWNTLVEHEYMFGPDLLVAPVYFGHTKKWQVYLPQGQWCDFWSGAALEGGRDWLVDAGVEQIPVFARAGAIIPFLDGNPDTLLPSEDSNTKTANADLRLQIYPGADGEFKMYDGSLFHWSEQSHVLSIQHVPSPRWISFCCMGSKQSSIYATGEDGNSLPLTTGSLNDDRKYMRIWVESSANYQIKM